MNLEKLEPIRVETGFTFGQECYLNPSRAEEFLNRTNEISPNLFTRRDFDHLPKRFTFENFNGTKLCTARQNSFNYTVQGSVDNELFKQDVDDLFGTFRNLFALNDVRRVGKIYDFLCPTILTNNSLPRILAITEHVQVSNLHLLFREQGKNINVHFLPIAQGAVEIAGRRINLDAEPIVRCDINNIDTNSPLNVSDTLTDVYGFADSYVQENLVNFLEKYFGAQS